MPTARCSGFSLLEVMIALAVLATALAALFAALATASRVAERARQRDIAVKQVQVLIEDLAPTTFANLDAYAALDFAVDGLSPLPGRRAVGHVQRTGVEGSAATMRISCDWLDDEGPQSLAVDCIIADHG